MGTVNNLLFINDLDAFATWGVTIKKGSLGEFLKQPERKIAYAYEYKDEPGIDYDKTEAFIPKTLDYNITFNFTSGDISKLEAFQTYIKNNRDLTFRIPSLNNKTVKVFYINSSPANIISLSGGFYCDMAYIFRNNFE